MQRSVQGRGRHLLMRAAVLGSPIAHSLSPVMHRAAYAAAGLDWTYDAIDVPAGGLAAVVSGLGDEWRGLSVTAPLKPEAAAFATDRTPVVERLGAANTLVRTSKGWTADNTDVPGALAALAEAGISVLDVVRILGAGA
ncbi:MAG TPA: shikimate dehydrogenase, partial [Aeromicrobium sp.]|nr:shikimate dehydrogenase [Aeromicrobium sp.]